MTVIPFPGAHMTDERTPAAPTCAAGTRRPHPATDGLLCRHHLEELGKWLRDIEDEAARLSTAPRLETSYGTGGSSLASQRSPVVEDAVVMVDDRSTLHAPRTFGPVCITCPAALGHRCTCPPGPTKRRTVHWAGCPRQYVHDSCITILTDRDEYESGAAGLAPILATLHGWAQQVRDERRLEAPAGDVVTPLAMFGEWQRTYIGPTIMSERRVLTRHLGWIAGRDWVIDMRRAIGDLRRDLMRLNRNTDPKPLPGYCYRLVDGEECGGDLWPAEPTHTTGYETKSGLRAVVCGRHPDKHRWQGEDLPRLLVIIDTQKSRKEEAS